MRKRQYLILNTSYLILILGLFLYSYTQVDLNLTLSQINIWRALETSFQYIGWFQRPLSTLIYVIILFLLSTFYFLLIYLTYKNKITQRQFWKLVLPTSIILLFSYNAFSYDLFNYLFDARIVTLYHQNPYFQKALDYPMDPWINFMRWTHRTYPYGPVWLGLTAPLSLIGMQFFLPTLFLFKSLMVAAYLGTIYFIGKIMGKINPDKKFLAMNLFAFNPLIIIESLVSGHNDIVMICLAVMSYYFLLRKKYIWCLVFLLFSIGIKFATILLSPVFLLVILWKNRHAELVSASVMILAVIFASFRTEFQPWYLIWVLPFIFTNGKRWLIIPSVIVSLGVLIQYTSFLYTGSWDPTIAQVKLYLIVSSIILGVLLSLVVKL